MNIIAFDYVNEKDRAFTQAFMHNKNVKKYILGINKLTKSVLKHLEVDGVIDDFTRVQRSRKKSVLHIENIPKDALILTTSMGSPLEVKNSLDKWGYENCSYLSFYKYSQLELLPPPFMLDFKEDFENNQEAYETTYKSLADEESKAIFEKLINFKISFDLGFMQGFTNDHEGQYFDKALLPNIQNIRFVDGGGYVGDTLKEIIKNYPDYEKIYCIEPSTLHMNIAKRDFASLRGIEFINCGLGCEKSSHESFEQDQSSCDHHFQAQDVDTLDKLIKDEVDYIKLDIEGAEQAAIQGAKSIILNAHPILAICIYHKAEDWYKVPQKVLAIRDDYEIYLRHYMEGIYETVMYFIPKSYNRATN